MSNSENIITDIQQTIRLEFKKLGQAKSKTELLSESNLLYRSVCNDADNLFEPLNEWVDSIDLQNVTWAKGKYVASELSSIYTKNDVRVGEIITNLNKYTNEI